tara:strand:+ start:579 stop:2096 length:1518 start_codon:yes stop_codon:yes gene_type:complete
MMLPKVLFKNNKPISTNIYKIFLEQKDKNIHNVKYLILSLQDGSNNAGRIIIKKGQKVFKNQILTLPASNSNNTPIHSPCNGIIEEISSEDHLYIKELKTTNIKIKILDNSPSPPHRFIESRQWDFINILNYNNLITKIRYSGIIGLGGAGFPSFKKILNQKIDYLIINGAECEPPISADAALMSDTKLVKNIISGITILKNILTKYNNNLKIIIAIEDNKKLAIKNFKKIIKHLSSSLNIILKTIPSAYPNGDAKYLINLLLNKTIPKNQHSTAHGILCFNVATVYSIYNAVYKNQPLTHRIVTISGNAIKNPCNYEFPIGMPITKILEILDLKDKSKLNITMGGYFMGVSINNFEAGILKTTNSLIINYKENQDKKISECINCGFCVSKCPQNLLPQQLYKFSKNEDINNLKNNNVMHCIECGLCDTACPSNINITEYIQYGKNLIKNNTEQHNFSKELKQRYDNFQNRKLKLEQKKQESSKAQTKINKSELLKQALARAKNK